MKDSQKYVTTSGSVVDVILSCLMKIGSPFCEKVQRCETRRHCTTLTCSPYRVTTPPSALRRASIAAMDPRLPRLLEPLTDEREPNLVSLPGLTYGTEPLREPGRSSGEPARARTGVDGGDEGGLERGDPGISSTSESEAELCGAALWADGAALDGPGVRSRAC